MEIFIPWRDSGCSYRKKHFLFLKKYYSEIANVYPVDSNYEIFNRSNARNKCVKMSKSDPLIIIDADNFICHDQIIKAINLSKKTKKIVRPFNSIHYLNRFATEKFYNNFKNFIPNTEDYEYMKPEQITMENSGGAYVIIKDIWENIGGMNENFIGWGGEDLEFNLRYQKIYGEQICVSGPNYNLHHPNDRIISKHNFDIITDALEKDRK